MRITVKLFASLAEYLPPGAQRNATEVEVPDGASVQEVLDRLDVPQEKTHLVICNGLYVPHSLRAVETLAAGDTLALWPPVAGG